MGAKPGVKPKPVPAAPRTDDAVTAGSSSPSRPSSPRLGRFSPILRALFASQAQSATSTAAQNATLATHPAPTPKIELQLADLAVQDALETPLDDEFTLDAPSASTRLVIGEGGQGGQYEDKCVEDRGASHAGFDAYPVAQYDGACERPPVLPYSFLPPADRSSHSPSSDASQSTRRGASRSLWSPTGQSDDPATPLSTPSSTVRVKTFLSPPSPRKAATKKRTTVPSSQPVVGIGTATTTVTTTVTADLLLLPSPAETLNIAEQMLALKYRNFNHVTDRNYSSLARCPTGSLVGLFDEQLPFFCPVPLSPLSRLTSLNYANYQPSGMHLVSNSHVNPVYESDRQAKLDLIAARLLLETTKDLVLQQAHQGTSAEGIHVFVDMSNIVIGFYNRVKRNRGVHPAMKLYAPPFFFDGLSLIMERNRNVAKRVVAGSAVDRHNRESWPDYMKDAAQAGYEMNILARVSKPPQSPTRRPRNRRTGNYSSNNNTSDEDTTASANLVLRQGEQAVDEVLHLKMCESVIDYHKSTIVLATGDAAEAEFSAGFRAMAERALSKGWHVELVTWRSTISSSWLELEKSGRWGNQFRIISLDWYVEELFDAY